MITPKKDERGLDISNLSLRGRHVFIALRDAGFKIEAIHNNNLNASLTSKIEATRLVDEEPFPNVRTGIEDIAVTLDPYAVDVLLHYREIKLGTVTYSAEAVRIENGLQGNLGDPGILAGWLADVIRRYRERGAAIVDDLDLNAEVYAEEKPRSEKAKQIDYPDAEDQQVQWRPGTPHYLPVAMAAFGFFLITLSIVGMLALPVEPPTAIAIPALAIIGGMAVNEGIKGS